MTHLQLAVHLESDITFGRGEGLAGLVDEEIEYDVATGLPFVRGRTLKGLLVEECANLMFALDQSNSPVLHKMKEAAAWLFGRPGSDLESAALVHFGPALFPQELRDAVRSAIEDETLKPADVLNSLTAIRRQTAINEASAAPEKDSLRSMRVVLHNTSFRASLDCAVDPQEDALALLAACAFGVRRGGIGRNRGRGRLHLELLNGDGKSIQQQYFDHFRQMVTTGGQV